MSRDDDDYARCLAFLRRGDMAGAREERCALGLAVIDEGRALRHDSNYLVVDRPGRSGPAVYEGRLLPAARRADYQPMVDEMRSRGAPVGEDWLVLRDGERPRRAWLPVIGSVLLLVVLAINVRALVRALFLRPRERR